MANRFLLLPAGSSLFVSVHESGTKRRSDSSGDGEWDYKKKMQQLKRRKCTHLPVNEVVWVKCCTCRVSIIKPLKMQTH